MVPHTIEGCRHLLLAVGEMHRTGFQHVRIRPYLADSAGGGRWVCWLVPAGLAGSPPDRGDALPFFPYLQNDRPLAFPAHPGETAAEILDLFPQLASAGRGADAAYAGWYAEALRLTAPLGLVIKSHFADGLGPPPAGWRVVGGASGVAVVPAPPAADPSLPRAIIRPPANDARQQLSDQKCERCRRGIERDLLRALPGWTRCRRCQIELEQGGG